MKNKPTAWNGKPSQIAKAKSWKKIQAMRRQADYWRKVWKERPEAMRANLERINSTRKRKAEERTAKLLQVCSSLPENIFSLDLKDALSKCLADGGYNSDRRAVTKLISALRRRKMLTFDSATLTWAVAKR